MAIRLKLGNYETVQRDPIGRTFVGYFPRMTETEAWEAGRGMWKVSGEKVMRQHFALIVGEGLVRAVAEISAVTAHGDRMALDGTVLTEGHPVRDAWLGKPDPVVNGSQNPIGYVSLPEEEPYVFRPCACDCGEKTDLEFLPGHDVRAIKARVREHFGGSSLKFITWVDGQLAGGAAFSGKDKWPGNTMPWSDPATSRESCTPGEPTDPQSAYFTALAGQTGRSPAEEATRSAQARTSS